MTFFVPITIRIDDNVVAKNNLEFFWLFFPVFFLNFLNSNEELLIYQDLVKN